MSLRQSHRDLRGASQRDQHAQGPLRRGQSERSQRGLSASTQFAVIFPVLMLLMLGLIQAGIWLHARNVAAQAANAAADVARNYQGDAGAARRAAEHVAAVGGLEQVTIAVDRGADQVGVTLTARPPTLFDIGLGTIRETATAPVERVTAP